MQLPLKKIILIFILPMVYFSCNLNEYDPSIYKPKAKTDFGQILFSLPKKYWNHPIGNELKSQFERLNKATPLPYEKYFEIDFIVPENLVNKLKNKSCIIAVKIDPSQPSFIKPTYIRDLWANGQLVAELSFKNTDKALHYFSTSSSELINEINAFYYQSILMGYSKNNIINTNTSKKFKLNIKAPKEMKLNKKSKHFWWFSQLEMKKDQNGTHEIQKGIVIYNSPYTSKNQFTINYQQQIRDSISKMYLKGTTKDSYMISRNDDLAPMESEAMYVNDKYVFKTTGAWKMVNDKMGGPFINYAFLSKNNREIINIDGYVYAPNFEKSKLIRELEAIIYSALN